MDSYECIWIHGQWPIIWMDGQGVGENMTGKISDKEVWGRHGEDMDKKHRNSCISCECSLQGS